MVSGTTWVAIGLIVALIAIGVAQHFDLPKSTLAGAVTTSQTQEEINGCMQKCMNSCVTVAGTEISCTETCNKQCFSKTP